MGWFSRKKKSSGQEGIIRIRLSGDENLDIENSFKKMGISSKEEKEEILKEYTWHYLDDLDENLECTMQLVRSEALESAKPFIDSRDIMEEAMGITYIRKNCQATEQYESQKTAMEKDLSEVRKSVMSVCETAGYKPAKSLPWIKEIEIRPATEIAARLHMIKAVCLWVLFPQEQLADERIIDFIERNQLQDHMTEEEEAILSSTRNDEEIQNSIGWKFENAWPLAWYFGFDEPEIMGQMMTGEQMQDILVNHTCSIDDKIDSWMQTRDRRPEESLIEKEDLFYCIHNAVRSAQLGHETVPEGFDHLSNGGVIHERRHSLTWMLSKGTYWEDTDLSS